MCLMMLECQGDNSWVVEEGAAYVTSKNEQAQAAQPGTTDSTDSMDIMQLTQGEPALPVARRGS